ncbi:MAG: phosphatidylserine decarboxylase family protein [Bacteroidetes bacterium]|nr:phosphatidylserine decarboxylase family protein [Bacteroidota bacterium]
MITRYGYDVVLTVTGICGIILFIALLFIEPRIVRYSIVVLVTLFVAFTVYFFRDPERRTPQQERAIVAPADGKIISIKTVAEEEFFKGPATLISIFMSPLNVHVNRVPASGKVLYTRYVEGEYFAAFEEKASEKNEQMIVGIETPYGKVLFKQIAGFIARRIVCELQVGDSVSVGKRFGMIKFGSRVDVFLPPNVNVCVNVGSKTKAGETILAEFTNH